MDSRDRKNQRELHAKTLEGIVTANGFFTAAVLIGVTNTVTPSPGIPLRCIPGDDIRASLIIFEALSFSFYILSSLIAQGMKIRINHLQAIDPEQIRYDVPWMNPPSQPEDMEEFSGRYIANVEQTYHWNQNTVSMCIRHTPEEKKKELWGFRTIMMSSVAFSVLGSFFVLLAMIDVVQLKLGLLSCGSTPVAATVAVMLAVGFVGLPVFAYAVFRSLKEH